MNDFEFGNYLCRLREKKGFTQKELADRLGMSDKAVSKWENGRSRPKSQIIMQLARSTTSRRTICFRADGRLAFLKPWSFRRSKARPKGLYPDKGRVRI